MRRPALRADARRNRDQVLRTAQRLFASNSLGVSLDEIARRAGVGPGTVHRHFPSKESLYLAVAIDQLGRHTLPSSSSTGYARGPDSQDP
ncbi:helix-turn-helix domain-containing protein [Actinopolymorpha sp. NPDC004070]|uniref:TetR/AcrR family transcriptional regulator n=1 Tax=Actinopolymorpha sp. NPDC004070 TaxID=3154548 RepID=UPI0033AD0B7C